MSQKTISAKVFFFSVTFLSTRERLPTWNLTPALISGEKNIYKFERPKNWNCHGHDPDHRNEHRSLRLMAQLLTGESSWRLTVPFVWVFGVQLSLRQMRVAYNLSITSALVHPGMYCLCTVDAHAVHPECTALHLPQAELNIKSSIKLRHEALFG